MHKKNKTNNFFIGLALPFNRRLKKAHFQPMIAAVQGRMEGWKSRLLSLGGRVTLVKSVMSAMPIHNMRAFKIPKCVVKHTVRCDEISYGKETRRARGSTVSLIGIRCAH